MRLGLVYGEQASLELTRRITSCMMAAAIQTSVDLAEKKGPFAMYPQCRKDTLRVLQLHFEAVKNQDLSDPFWQEQHRSWSEVLQRAEAFGVRNSQWTLIAPTGTIGLMMDCDTLGIEPEFSLVKTKVLAGGGQLTLVNRSVESALVRLGLDEQTRQRALAHLSQHHTLEDFEELTEAQRSVFLTAVPVREGGKMLPWKNHLAVMSAAQPFLSGAISKTINLPASARPQDISDIFLTAHELGLKSVSVYREGSKGSQPLRVAPLNAEIQKHVT